MMQWIKFTPHNLPPQGLKILCFRKGDVWICRRINYKGKDYYLELPYAGNGEAIATDEPDYWMQMDLPEGCTGFMKIAIDGGKLLTFDELQVIDPKSHEEFMAMMVHTIRKQKKEK